MTTKNKKLLGNLIKDIKILRMKNFCQHGTTSTYEHAINVVKRALIFSKIFHLTEEQEENLIIGALLHDYYLYDWHHTRKRPEGLHCFSHPKVSLANAMRDFDLNENQKNIIRSHMFPATLLHPPKCKEAWIVTFADKYCAIQETLIR